jgi:beta-lactamase class A
MRSPDRVVQTAWLCVSLCLAAVASPPLAAGPAQAGSGLQRVLAAELGRFPGRVGVWVKHLTTGEEAAIAGDDTFNSASVIKLPVFVMAYQLSERGTLSLDERITIRKQDIRGGSGVLRYHDLGLQPTLRDVLMQMIITSDNTATDLAIARVGGVARVNAWMKENGMAQDLRLTQTTGELFAKYGALPQGANRNEKTNADRAYWLGEMTPRATGHLLEAIERGTLTSKTASDEMLRVMRAQQAGARRLPHFLDVPVAHKTGDFPPVLANDVGIAFARSGPIVIAVFANAITGPYGEAEDRIGRVAQLIVEYFGG